MAGENIAAATVHNEDKEESGVAERWLRWCRQHKNIKCIEFPVPQGVFPSNYKGTLIDVKVGGKRRCPDDMIYSKDSELRSKVARGNCVLELNYLSEHGVRTISYYFLIFALKKFSGGMGDEDEDSASCQNLWQNYFLKEMNYADKVIVTAKANGEAGHLSCRRIAGHTIFCLGSKNVHLVARHTGDLTHYTARRFDTAMIVAKSFFNTYLDNPLVTEKQREQLISYLQRTKYTAVMEVLQPANQHIEDLSYLSSPELRFICWTSIYSEDCDSLCAFPPNAGIDQAREFGLSTITYEVIEASEAESYMLKIRSESGYEGKVLYFLDLSQNVFGIIKKKTVWYIILRALREKACGFCSRQGSNTSSSEMDKKVTKRIHEIQVWLGFSDVYRKTWEKLGVAFVTWLVNKTKNQSAQTAVRAKFPQLWMEFLQTHENFGEISGNLIYS